MFCISNILSSPLQLGLSLSSFIQWSLNSSYRHCNPTILFSYRSFLKHRLKFLWLHNLAFFIHGKPAPCECLLPSSAASLRYHLDATITAVVFSVCLSCRIWKWFTYVCFWSEQTVASVQRSVRTINLFSKTLCIFIIVAFDGWDLVKIVLLSKWWVSDMFP